MSEIMTVEPVVTPGAGTDTPGTVDTGASTGGEVESPKSFSVSFDEGEEPVEINVENLESEEDSTPKELKFEDLKSYFKDDDPAHQETYKSLKRPLSEYTRYKKTFETPEAATAHMEKINDLVSRTGIEGAKGLDGIEQYVDATNHILEGIRTGSKDVIPRLFANSPEGLSKFAQEATNEWYKSDKQGWTKHHADVMWSTLTTPDGNGMTALAALQQAYNKTDDPDVKAMLERVGKTIETVANATKYAGKGVESDPGIVAEKSRLQTEKMKLFVEKADYSVDRILGEASSKTLGEILRQAKIADVPRDKRGEYISFLRTQFNDLMKKDPAVMTKLKEARDAMDVTKVESIIKSVRSKMMAEAGKELWRKHLGPKKGQVRTEAGNRREASGGGGSNEPGALKYTGDLQNYAPPINIMDYPRMKARDAETGKSMLEGRMFYMKGKKEAFYW